MSNNHDMQSCAVELFDKGYNVVPVLPNSKRITLPNWAAIRRNRAQLLDWVRKYPAHNVGTITRDTPFIDIDITDSVVSSKIYMQLLTLFEGYSIATRTGKAPKLAIPCNLPYGFEPFKKSKSNIYTDLITGVDQAVEILADGQMCLMKGIHPDTRKPYDWDVEDIPNLENLPILTTRIIDTIFAKFEELAEKKVAAGTWKLKQNKTATSLVPAQRKKRKKPKANWTVEQLKDVLDDVPELTHDDWLRLGMGLHHQFEGGKAGLILWTYFSFRFPATFNKEEIVKRYATLNKDPSSKGCTIGTVIGFRNKYLASQEPEPIFEITQRPISPSSSPNQSPSAPLQTPSQSPSAPLQTPGSNINSNSSTSKTTKKITPPKTPSTTAKPKPKRPRKWYDGWYFISSMNKLFNAVTKECIKPDSFNFVFANELVAAGELRGTPSGFVSRMNLIPKMSGITYLPGYARELAIGNQKFVNSFNAYIPKGKVPDKYKEPTLLVNFLNRMMHDKIERMILLDFMAHVVQKPGQRINWAPILLGIQGTGKTTILEIMTIALGTINAKPVSAALFTNSFNSYAEGSMFVFVEEIKISGDNRHRVLDRVKEIITNNIVNLTNKGQDSREIRNVTSYMLGTNHPDALPIDDEDRRYAVLQTILDLTEQEFAVIYAFLEDEDNHWNIQQWLLRHEISAAFNARGRAPKTNATTSMVANTEDLLIAKIQEAIDKNSKLVNSSFISFAALKEIVSDDMTMLQDRTLSNRIRNKLIQMHYTRAGSSKRTYTMHGIRHTVFKPDINLQRTLKLPDDHFDTALERAAK